MFKVRLQKRTAECEREPVPLEGSRLFLCPGTPRRGRQQPEICGGSQQSIGKREAFTVRLRKLGS
ncbi:hypothetical protein ACH95_08570 [Bacillus glycinifermentans]|nr:hypothetical protein ACH95_08570 [Bacillus glycinifermentans]